MNSLNIEETWPFSDDIKQDLNNESHHEDRLKRHKLDDTQRRKCRSPGFSNSNHLLQGIEFKNSATKTAGNIKIRNQSVYSKQNLMRKGDRMITDDHSLSQFQIRKLDVKENSARLKARLQAASAGLQELTLLREAQQSKVDQAKSICQKNEQNPGHVRARQEDKQVWCVKEYYLLTFFVVRFRDKLSLHAAVQASSIYSSNFL